MIELKNGIPTVKRRSHQEAVVGTQVKPISDLIMTRELRTPLKKALLIYLRSEGETCGKCLQCSMSIVRMSGILKLCAGGDHTKTDPCSYSFANFCHKLATEKKIDFR